MNLKFKSLSLVAFATGALFLGLVACEKLVDDGYRIDYGQSDAEFQVEPLGLESGAAGDVISYKLSVTSSHPIKSCIVQASQEGAGGSGYDVATEGFDDPFADHNYGTVKKDVKSFTVKYDYIIPEDVNKVKITFSVIDDMGQVSQVVNITVVPNIKKYSNKSLYAQNSMFNDAFATIDGLVYPNIRANYGSESQENIAVQEKIDIFFYHDLANHVSVISAPDDGSLGVELKIENATRFQKLDLTTEDFENITAGSLVELTREDSINYKGTSRVTGISVGDVVGFVTDLNALHSLKTGLIKVKSLHPANVNHYDGTSYVMECDIVTQID